MLDEVAEQRDRRARAALAGLPHQRTGAALSELDREEYEQRLDAYEVQLHEYRARLREYASQLEEAHHDGLTGTWVRHAGRQLLDNELLRAARSSAPLSIAFIDVDGLKALNDSEGHAAGDRALATVAEALLAGLRGYDHVIRWGGDEFLAILPGLTRPQAELRLEQARARMAEAPGSPRVSVGIAERCDREAADSLVARADQALYVSRGRAFDR